MTSEKIKKIDILTAAAGLAFAASLIWWAWAYPRAAAAEENQKKIRAEIEAGEEYFYVNCWTCPGVPPEQAENINELKSFPCFSQMAAAKLIGPDGLIPPEPEHPLPKINLELEKYQKRLEGYSGPWQIPFNCDANLNFSGN